MQSAYSPEMTEGQHNLLNYQKLSLDSNFLKDFKIKKQE